MALSNRARRSLLLAACVLGATAFVPAPAAAETNTLEQARERGFIRIAFANEAPFGFAAADGTLSGEAPEIAKLVFQRMGIPEVDGVLTEWGSLIPGLRARRFDVIAAGMFITPERCRQVAFSEPTYKLGQGFLVSAGNPKNLRSYTDMARNGDARLGVLAGAVEYGYALDAGVPEARIMRLPDQASMVGAVRAGRIDAAALTAVSIERMAQQGGNAVERASPFETPPGAIGYGAFAFRPGDKALRQEFNRHLKELIGTPEHLKLVRQFGFTENELPGDRTTTQLCKG